MPLQRLQAVLATLLLLTGALHLACDTDSPQPAASAPSPASAVDVPPTMAPAPDASSASPSSASGVAQALQGVNGIVDPSNLEWPRQVVGLNGIVTIPAKPQRIITASVGHDETVLALTPAERLVAVGSATKSATFSNVPELVQDKPEITRDPETIIEQAPDVIVTSPFFPDEGIDALERVGIPVVQTELKHDPEARIDNILFIGYILGEEERAIRFAAELRARYEALVSVTGAASPQPRVLAVTQYSDTLWVAGDNSTEGGVILAAGGVNAAAAGGIEGNQTTNLEGVIAMAPEVIVIPQPIDFGANEFRQSLLDNPALAEVPAIKDDRVYVVESRRFTTLSFWNILGAEALAHLLWPDAFSDAPSPAFSPAE